MLTPVDWQKKSDGGTRHAAVQLVRAKPPGIAPKKTQNSVPIERNRVKNSIFDQFHLIMVQNNLHIGIRQPYLPQYYRQSTEFSLSAQL